MREKISEALKTALKSGDRPRASTLRMVNAAIQDRDIARSTPRCAKPRAPPPERTTPSD